MKHSFIFILLLLFSAAVPGQVPSKKKKELPVTDKIYKLEKKEAEITVGNNAEAVVKKEKQRPAELWNVSLDFTNLTYELPSFLGGAPSFSPTMPGLLVGKKIEDQFFLYKGHLEISLEWQRFSRESNRQGFISTQNLNLYSMNLFQNFNVTWAFKRSVFFSVGVGFSPLYLTAERSVFGNSESSLGYMGSLKADLIYPVPFFKESVYEIDLAFKSGWGTVGSREFNISALSLGVNFE